MDQKRDKCWSHSDEEKIKKLLNVIESRKLQNIYDCTIEHNYEKSKRKWGIGRRKFLAS